jgi:hypothetical protein
MNWWRWIFSASALGALSMAIIRFHEPDALLWFIAGQNFIIQSRMKNEDEF